MAAMLPGRAFGHRHSLFPPITAPLLKRRKLREFCDQHRAEPAPGGGPAGCGMGEPWMPPAASGVIGGCPGALSQARAQSRTPCGWDQ